jgi:hypothetical protein
MCQLYDAATAEEIPPKEYPTVTADTHAPAASPDSPACPDTSNDDSQHTGLPADKSNQSVQCVVCYDPYHPNQEHISFIRPCFRCNVPYCRKCLLDMFVGATKDLSRMPPMCCNQIPLYLAQPFLSETQAANYRARHEEWSTPKPFYCPVPRCSAFISKRLLKVARDVPASSEKRADSVVGTPTSPSIQCPACSTSICTNCRDLAHTGSGCKQLDFGVDDATADLLKRWGYKRCPKCGQGVRKMHGCSHIACLCGAHWCWHCQGPINECYDCYDDEDDDEDYYESEEDEPEPTEPEPVPEPEAEEVQEDPDVVESDDPHLSALFPIDPLIYQYDFTPPNTGTRRRRRRSFVNLDGRPAYYWEEQGLDFGPEPRNDFEDAAWNCKHEFSELKVPFKDLPRVQLECEECWAAVQPQIQREGRHRGRIVAPMMGRGGEKGGRGRARSVPRLELEGQGMDSGADQLVSHNQDRVTDTYGNVLHSTDFVFRPKPRRRASFDASVSRSSVPAKDGDRPDEKEKPTFQLALSCLDCHTLSCHSCRKEMIAEGRARDVPLAR